MTGSVVSGQAVSRKQEEWCTIILIGLGQEIISTASSKCKNKTKQHKNYKKGDLYLRILLYNVVTVIIYLR